jgi:hypothetical protein
MHSSDAPRTIGGLISTTFLDFFIRAALFWCYGRQAVEPPLKSRRPEPAPEAVESRLVPGRPDEFVADQSNGDQALRVQFHNDPAFNPRAEDSGVPAADR